LPPGTGCSSSASFQSGWVRPRETRDITTSLVTPFIPVNEFARSGKSLRGKPVNHGVTREADPLYYCHSTEAELLFPQCFAPAMAHSGRGSRDAPERRNEGNGRRESPEGPPQRWGIVAECVRVLAPVSIRVATTHFPSTQPCARPPVGVSARARPCSTLSAAVGYTYKDVSRSDAGGEEAYHFCRLREEDDP
jgi:hypothetical protein